MSEEKVVTYELEGEIALIGLNRSFGLYHRY
jgi:hypothetical protein